MFAVSTELPPRSRYAARIRFESCELEPHPLSSPKVMVPRVIGLTRRPDLPRVTYEDKGMNLLRSRTAQPANPDYLQSITVPIEVLERSAQFSDRYAHSLADRSSGEGHGVIGSVHADVQPCAGTSRRGRTLRRRTSRSSPS